MDNPTIYIHTDGSSNKEKTVGGWAFCLSMEKNSDPFHTDSGAISGTHNTAELTALLNAIHHVYGNYPKATKIIAFTDSKYVADPIYFDSLRVWENAGWRTNAGSPVANVEVWKEMKILLKKLSMRKISLEVRWVKGHNGNKLNEIADDLAGKASRKGLTNALYE